MKTLFTSLLALGLLSGAASAQHVSFGHRAHAPAICNGVVHAPQRVVQVTPAPAEQAPQAAAPAPEAPADQAPAEEQQPPK